MKKLFEFMILSFCIREINNIQCEYDSNSNTMVIYEFTFQEQYLCNFTLFDIFSTELVITAKYLITLTNSIHTAILTRVLLSNFNGLDINLKKRTQLFKILYFLTAF